MIFCMLTIFNFEIIRWVMIFSTKTCCIDWTKPPKNIMLMFSKMGKSYFNIVIERTRLHRKVLIVPSTIVGWLDYLSQQSGVSLSTEKRRRQIYEFARLLCGEDYLLWLIKTGRKTMRSTTEPTHCWIIKPNRPNHSDRKNVSLLRFVLLSRSNSNTITPRRKVKYMQNEATQKNRRRIVPSWFSHIFSSSAGVKV